MSQRLLCLALLILALAGLMPGAEDPHLDAAGGPTVATPAAATVGATSAALSVLGADPAGAASLTYTWSASPATVTFSPNGTNAAQNTTAAFSAAGAYTFTATITDPSALSATSAVSATVAPVLTAVAVSAGPDVPYSLASVTTNGRIDCEFMIGSIAYFGGIFSTVTGTNGTLARANAAAVDLSTGAVTAWNPGITGGVGNGYVYTDVRAMATDGNVAYLVGTFAEVGSTARANAAAVDLYAGAPTSWAPALSDVGYAPGCCIAVDPATGLIYLGGELNTINGVSCNGAACLNAAGTLQSWNPPINTPGVLRMMIDSTRIYLVGWPFAITTIGATQDLGVAAFNKTTGAYDPTFTPVTMTGSLVQAVCMFNGDVYFGGPFSVIDGSSRSNFAAVDGSGNLLAWAPSTDTPAGAGVEAMTSDGSDIISVGNFSMVNGTSHPNAVALTTGGVIDPASDFPTPGISGTPEGVYFDATDDLYITGFDNDPILHSGKPFTAITSLATAQDQTRQGFQAEGIDQFGNVLATEPAFTWAGTGAGSIGASTGLLNCGTVSGAAEVTASATGPAGRVSSPTVSVTITDGTTAPTITWATPASITAGMPLTTTQLNATASVPGTFVYNPPLWSILAAGTTTLSVTFTPTNTTTYGPAFATTTISVAAAPVITSSLSASGQTGTAFSYQITAANGPTSYGASGLPAGLSVSSSSGLISGTPTSAGSSVVTLSATNAIGTGTARLSLSITTSNASGTTAGSTTGSSVPVTVIYPGDHRCGLGGGFALWSLLGLMWLRDRQNGERRRQQEPKPGA